MKKLKFDVIFIIVPFVFILCNSMFSQSVKENWVLASSEDDNKIYVNATGLTENRNNDLYVWVLEEFNSPLQLEGIDEKIYFSKTYYLFGKQKHRYSILQVIYYDEDRNVLKNYSYEHNSDIQDFKYNTPILEGSTAEAILNKCIELTK